MSAYTSANKQVTYDTLLVACGALPFPSIPGALTFRGPADIEVIEHVLDEVEDGDVRSVAFVIPWGAVWSLPAYELALLTAAHVRERGLQGVRISVVTPEAEPLQLFGQPATEAVQELLEDRGVSLQNRGIRIEVRRRRTRTHPRGPNPRGPRGRRFHGSRALLSTGCRRPWTGSFRSTPTAGCTE